MRILRGCQDNQKMKRGSQGMENMIINDHSEAILVNHNKLKSMNVNKSELCYVVCEKSMLFNSPQVRKLFKGNRYMYFVLNHFLYGMQNIDNLRLKYF